MSYSDTQWRIKGARVLDPFRGVDKVQDVYVRDGVVADGPERGEPVATVEADGLWLVPRLTDMHVHFREPGQEWKEDLRSGSRAAAAGGFTVVATMPNTRPVVDIASLVEWQRTAGKEIGLVRIMPIGAVTKGSRGDELAELYEMELRGAVGFSDDGRPVARSRVMRAALSYSTTLGHPIIQHAEDPELAENTVMHEGAVSHRMGLPGAPAEAEAVMVWRDVELVRLTGGRLHVAHITAAGSLAALAYAREEGLRVSAEATPHHLLLTDEEVAEWGYSTVTKVNPPLRPGACRDRLRQAVRSGLVSVIASDHAPHHQDEKDRPYQEAPYGISGIETSLAAAMEAMLHSGLMTPLEFFARMTLGPDEVLGLGYPGLVAGAPADLTLIDPAARWVVDPGKFYSKGKNTPWAGKALTGRAVATMCGGRWTMREGQVLA